MLKVMIADKFPEQKQGELRAMGVEVAFEPDLTAETLAEAIPGTHILCVRSTQVTQATIEAGQDLMLIVRVGSGFNTIDLRAASSRGIFVANCPGKNAIAVAELTMGLLLSVDRRIPQATRALREGQWSKKEFSKADGLKGKRMGLAGFGRIGQEVARRALAFELRVMALDIGLTPEEAKAAGVERCPDLPTLCQSCDIISVHLPLLDATRGMFGAEQFAMMPPGAIFLNTSRGEIHDQEALLNVVRSGHIRAGLDVFVGEPSASHAEFSAEIAREESFVGTPHIGASTEQAQLSVASEAIRIIESFLKKGIVPNCVNLAQHSDAQCKMIVRHFDKVGVLASIMNLLQQDNINIEEMGNIIFKGSGAAVATMSLSHRPSQEVVEKLRGMPEKIIQVMVV